MALIKHPAQEDLPETLSERAKSTSRAQVSGQALPASKRLIDAGAEDFQVWCAFRTCIPQPGDTWITLETMDPEWVYVEKAGLNFQGLIDDALVWLKEVTAWLDTVRPTSPGC